MHACKTPLKHIPPNSYSEHQSARAPPNVPAAAPAPRARLTMLVSKAKTQASDGAAQANPASSSYAPLYLTSNLRNVAFDIQELESYALDRLALLKAIDAARAAAVSAPPGRAVELVRQAARAAERQHGLHVPPPGNPGREELVLKDEASHFVLRLAMCRTLEQRNWALSLECALFAARLEGASTDYVLSAIRRAGGPPVAPVAHAELDTLRAELDDVARGPCRAKGGAQGVKFFRVAFEQVPGLVRARRVLVRGGAAFVPEAHVHDVVAGLFRARMSQSLALASKAVALADHDRRMRPILTSVRQHHAADARRHGFEPESAERISLAQLPESLAAMPLCMQNMLAQLRAQHHLRYAARLQLGAFLKGCGLTMDESLRFWRTEFGRGTIDASKFEKTYAYNIRHQYGKEGRRREITPFPCPRIIVERPAHGEHHGCPYREFQEPDLVAAVRRMGVDADGAKAVAAKAKEGNFQMACGMCFKATQPPPASAGDEDFWPSHPNEYFIEARRRRFAKKGAVKGMEGEESDEDMPLSSAVDSQGESQSQSNPDADTAQEQLPKSNGTGADVESVNKDDAEMVDGPSAEKGVSSEQDAPDEQETKRLRTDGASATQ